MEDRDMITAVLENVFQIDASTTGTLALCRESCKYKAIKQYYESKIEFLGEKHLTPVMIKLTCNDVPFGSAYLGSAWKRDRYIRKCVKYYNRKLRELERNHITKPFLGIF